MIITEGSVVVGVGGYFPELGWRPSPLVLPLHALTSDFRVVERGTRWPNGKQKTLLYIFNNYAGYTVSYTTTKTVVTVVVRLIKSLDEITESVI